MVPAYTQKINKHLNNVRNRCLAAKVSFFFGNLHWNDLVTLRLTRGYQLMYKFTFHAEKCNSLGITVIVIKSNDIFNDIKLS